MSQQEYSTKGILLIACGKYYGRYAYNLATSIKYFGNVPIHLCCDDSAISVIDTSVFDSIDNCFEEGKKDWAKVKMQLPKLSPFDETIYLDVDAVCLNDLSKLFEELKAFDVFVPVIGDKSNWADSEKVSKHIGKEVEVKGLQTSLIYFKNNKKAKEFFKSVNKFYDKPLPEKDYKVQWGLSKAHPDELYYAIAYSFLEMPESSLMPIFFPDKLEKVGTILKDYYLLSQFGAVRTVKQYSFDLYDKLMKSYLSPKEHYYRARDLYKNKFAGKRL